MQHVVEAACFVSLSVMEKVPLLLTAGLCWQVKEVSEV